MRKRRSCSTSSSLWSDLSHELISSISGLLKTPSDIRSFRGVCKKWRNHSIPLPPNLLNPLLPHPMPTFSCPSSIQADSNSGTLVIAARSIYLFNENQASWLVMAEEVNPGKIQLRHPLSGKLLRHSATNINLTRFEVSEVSKGYNLLHSKLSVVKVVLHFESASQRLSSADGRAAFILHGNGRFGALRLLGGSLNCNWHECGSVFEDFVEFKGMIVAVNYFGRLIKMDHEFDPISPLLSENVLTEGLSYSDSGNRRKRLVVDPLSDRLYLVVRRDMPLKLCVYVLNQQHKKWEIVKTFGRYKVLFVGIDQCFFSSARDFPGLLGIGNSIVFTDNAFPKYGDFKSISSDRSLFHGGDEQEKIMVHKLKGDDIIFVSEYPGLSQLMGTPPEWISGSTRVSKEEEKQSDSSSEDKSSSFCEEISAPLFEVASKDLTGIPSTSLVRTSCTNGVQHIDVEAIIPETLKDEIKHPGFDADTIQSNKSYTTVEFEELEIRATLVPTLQKIWLKYGNITKNSAICNSDIIARALESVAAALLILEGNSVRSLNDRQAHYLKSALSDFRHMNLEIDWLVPSIEKALALHENKPLIDSLNCLWSAKAKAGETRLNLHNELAKLDEMERELDESISMVSKMIPVTGLLDVDKPLVEGLP